MKYITPVIKSIAWEYMTTIVIYFFQLCLNAKSKEASAENTNAISIHIRLTDYVSHLTHFYNMTTISEEYLVDAMNYMDNQYKVSF